LRDTRTTRASDEPPLGSQDEGRRLIFEDKEDEEEEEEADKPVSSKRVRFEAPDLDSRTSKDLDPAAPSALLGMNAGAQLSQADLQLGRTGNHEIHAENGNGDDGVGVSMESPRSNRSRDTRSIEDKAGIILVSPILYWLV